MSERAFDLARFYAAVGAAEKERPAVRQDLVRGLKDYFASVYGYDRYGAETIFQLGDHLSSPPAYGFALLRILHDRRLPDRIKLAAAHHALDLIVYGVEEGLPHGLLAALDFLLRHDALPAADLRYALVASAPETNPYRGLDRATPPRFLAGLLTREDLSTAERLFWVHSLIARHRELAGTVELINTLADCARIPAEERREVLRSWLHFRQPRLVVTIPTSDGSARAAIVAQHLPFWVAHAPSWPTPSMVRLALIWLARLGEDPLALAEQYIDYHAAYADQVHAGVADILAEHAGVMPPDRLQSLIERGTHTGALLTRRRFYRLGAELIGREYLERATEDAAGSLRRWATAELARLP